MAGFHSCRRRWPRRGSSAWMGCWRIWVSAGISSRNRVEAVLEFAPQLTKSGGRIVVITFMSLEDRKVKQSFQSLARTGLARILTRHVVRPAEKEIQENPPSRSAKMRAVEML